MAKPYTYVRKPLKLGHSLVITIPSIFVKANGLTPDNTLLVEVYPDRLVILPQKLNSNTPTEK